MPFFPRILKHLIGFRYRIRQSIPGQSLLNPLLNAMTKIQKSRPAASKLTCQSGRGCALGNTPQNQKPCRGGSTDSLQLSSGEDVEQSATMVAEVVRNMFATVAMDSDACPSTAA